MTDSSSVERRGLKIVLDQLSVGYETEVVLSNVSAVFERSSFTSIIGPSGCGKSTLLRTIASLVSPTSGKVDIERGRDDRRHGQIAFVFQHANLLAWCDVRQNIGLPLELQRVPKAERQLRVDQSIDLVGLSNHDWHKYPRMLSGGMQMRVSLARALVTRPRVLLLDEPFAALDDLLRQQLNEELLRLWADEQWTGLFVTHNIYEAVFLSQRILIMSAQGRIADSLEVPFAYPRDAGLRGKAEFAALAEQVYERLREANQR